VQELGAGSIPPELEVARALDDARDEAEGTEDEEPQPGDPGEELRRGAAGHRPILRAAASADPVTEYARGMTSRSDLVPRRASKRLLDVTVSAVLLAAAAPLFAALLVVIALDMLVVARDRGPFLFRERRVSRGDEFDVLKLRTLRVDVLDEVRRSGGHARLAERDPANLTWAGRAVLKRWYLDELPQLLNVLRGEMSLVGPRPWPVEMAERQARDGLDYRYRIAAGWTGPAQVSKGSPDPVSYATLDVGYVEACRTWSSWRLLRLDLGLLAETVRVLARGEGLRF